MKRTFYGLRYKDPKQPYWIGIWNKRSIAEEMKAKHGRGTEIVILKEVEVI